MRTQQSHRFHIRRLITPSRFSAVTIVLIASLLCAGIVLLHNPHMLGLYNTSPPKTLTPEDIPIHNSSSGLATNWPIIVFWWVVGLPIYALAYYLVHTAQRASHAKRTYKQLKRLPAPSMEVLVEHLLLRMTALVTFIFLCILFVRNVVPFSALTLKTAVDSADNLVTLSGIILVILLLVVALHLLTIFLRLSLGKLRILS
jgi:hypothetical protein